MIRKKSGLNIIMPLELGMVITPEFLLFLLSAKILFPAKKVLKTLYVMLQVTKVIVLISSL